MKKVKAAPAAFALLLLAASSAAIAGDEVQALGKVKSVADDGSNFMLRGKRSSVRVDLGEQTKVVRFDANTSLAKLKGGETVHILGRKADAYRDPDTGALAAPKRIEQIRLIVTGEDFTPPPLTDAKLPKDVEWHEGSLVSRGGKEFVLDGHVIMFGKGRPVVAYEAAETKDIDKRSIVHIVGARTGEGKEEAIAATRVTLLGKRMQAADLPFVLGGGGS